jgi:hypothetical protein
MSGRCLQMAWLGASAAVSVTAVWEQAVHTCIFCFCQQARHNRGSVMAPLRVPRRLRALLDDVFDISEHLQHLHERKMAAAQGEGNSRANDHVMLPASGDPSASLSPALKRSDNNMAADAVAAKPSTLPVAMSTTDERGIRDILASIDE